jgi:hypothetical protein
VLVLAPAAAALQTQDLPAWCKVEPFWQIRRTIYIYNTYIMYALLFQRKIWNMHLLLTYVYIYMCVFVCKTICCFDRTWWYMWNPNLFVARCRLAMDGGYVEPTALLLGSTTPNFQHIH